MAKTEMQMQLDQLQDYVDYAKDDLAIKRSWLIAAPNNITIQDMVNQAEQEVQRLYNKIGTVLGH